MPKSPKSAPPRSNLTLEQHWQIIQYKKEHPTLSTAEIARVFAEKFNHPTLNQSTVSRTLNKEDRLRPFSTHTTRKKISQVRCPEVEEALMKWYSFEIEQGNVVTGPMLRGQAIKIADEMGIPEDQRPKYSNGWLDCYKSRHQLKFGNRPQSSTHSTTPTSAPAATQPQQQQQQSQVQVPPHLRAATATATAPLTPTTTAPSALSTLSIIAAASPRHTHTGSAHSSSSPISPYYSSPPIRVKSDPDAEMLDDHDDRDVSPESDIDTYSDSVSNSNSYPNSRSPSCCSYGTGGMREKQYNGYPSSYPSYPSYTSNAGYTYHHHTASSGSPYASSRTYPHTRTSPSYVPASAHGPTSPLSTASPQPAQDEDITRSIKKLKLHLESCPGLVGREGLLRNMEAIECAVSDCRSSLEPVDERVGGVGAVGARGGEPLSPLSPLSTTVESISALELRERRERERRDEESHSVSVPPQRRQRWLDLVTSPTDSDYSASSSASARV